MSTEPRPSDLKYIPIEAIDRNPENPRILFRQGELAELQESIRRYDVQVPISVYRKAGRYVLIDGERRWRCALKLNKKHIPAIVREEPDQLTNLLWMFNIHALREQWDLLTIALKLPEIRKLLRGELGSEPNERELAERTGLTRGLIRRAHLLMDLPDKYKKVILNELRKPKPEQRLTEDFFIEMERALKTVARKMPGCIDSEDRVRDVLVDKYQRGLIENITEFRALSKIARAKNVDADPMAAQTALRTVFGPNDYTIASAFDASVAAAYSERGVLSHIKAVSAYVARLQADEEEIDDDVTRELEALVAAASRVLRRKAP